MFELKRLPDELPVFPLTGALLLPKGHLPLNIFESRYLDMVYYAREKNGLIGMIQPDMPPLAQQAENDQPAAARRNRPLFTTGCVGMISDLKEVRAGQLTILLTGLSRFDIIEELPRNQTFRQMRVRYDRFREDCAAPAHSEDIARQRLVLTVEKYLKLHNMIAKWELLEKTCDEELINAMAMICPFAPSEKQALLEVITLKDRLELMLQIMEFDLSGDQLIRSGKILQ